jgi:hypothetical protein
LDKIFFSTTPALKYLREADAEKNVKCLGKIIPGPLNFLGNELIGGLSRHQAGREIEKQKLKISRC